MRYFEPTFANAVLGGVVGLNGVGKLALCMKSISAEYYIQILVENTRQVENQTGGMDHSMFSWTMNLVILQIFTS